MLHHVHLAGLQAADGARAFAGVLEREHRLVGPRGLDLSRIAGLGHQALERHLLVVHHRQQLLLHVAHEVGQRQRHVDRERDRQHVVEEAHDVFRLGLLAPAHRVRDDDGVVAGRLGHRHRVDAEGQHAERHVHVARHLAQPLRALQVDVDPVRAALAALARAARHVGLWRPHGPGAGEPAAPERELLLAGRLGQPGLQPLGVVAVGGGERGQVVRTAAFGGVVERAQLALHQVEGPAVPDQVMRHEQEDVLVVVELEQGRAHHRRAVDVERPVGQLLHLLDQLGLALVSGQAAQVDQRQGEFHRRCDRLNGPARVLVEADACAQRRLAADHFAQRAFEARGVELAGEPLRRGRVVDRTARVQLLHEADAFLRGRERRAAAIGVAGNRRLQADARALQRLDDRGQLLGRGRLEQRAQRQRDLELAAQQRGEPRGQQRVAAHGEEVVVHVQARQAQHLLHDREHLALVRVARTRAAPHLVARHSLRRRQRDAVDLAVGQRGQGVERHHVLRQHEGRQVLAQVHHQRIEVEAAAGQQRQVGHQAHVAGVVLAGHDHAARDAGHFAAAHLDLAGLDAVAAHLDLEVEPAEVVEQPVVAPAAAVAGAVDLLRGAEDAHRDEALGGQRGAVEVAQRDAFARDADFARHADRAGLQVGVENPDLGVVDGPADRDAARGDLFGTHMPGRGIHRRLGRAVAVPQAFHALAQRQRHARAQRLAAGPAAKTGRAAGPLGIEQQLPHAGRGLQQRDLFVVERLRQAVAVHGDLALHHHQFGARRQRQQQVGHGHVERQRGDGGDAVGRADARFALHPLQQVRHAPVVRDDALGQAGRAGGVDHIGRVFGPGVVAARRQRLARQLAPGGVAIDLEDALVGVGAPVARRHRDVGRGQHQAEGGVAGVVVQPRLRK
ncbi:hypothetical protein D3C87_982400 [compost metagenome]